MDTNWNSAAEARSALDAGIVPDGWEMDGETLVIPDAPEPGDRLRGHSSIFARFTEIRTASGLVLKSKNPDATLQAAKAAHFLSLLQEARVTGKGWWVDLQMKQIEEHLAHERTIADLLAALKSLCGPDASYFDNEIRIPRANHGDALATMRLARAAIEKAGG